VSILYIFSGFGITHQQKSGNPVPIIQPTMRKNDLFREFQRKLIFLLTHQRSVSTSVEKKKRI
jgi:hypothetical protein